jgi:DNA-binding response OmpR family regulator
MPEATRTAAAQAADPLTIGNRFNKAGRLIRPSDEVSDRAYLRVLIRQLRQKLGDDSSNPTYIETDGFIGYRFRDSQV